MILSSDIERLLVEDVGGGDLTTETLGIGGLQGIMHFQARGPMVVAGVEIARRMMGGLDVDCHARDGERLAPGAAILTAQGPAAELHARWKASQTLVEILSGIASATRELVDAVAGFDIRIATTRKTIPGLRQLSHLAVKAGGGILHRQGLGETMLVFAEHRAFLPGWSLAEIAARLRRHQPEKVPGIEVGTVDEAVAAIAAGFGLIQLEKFTPEEVGQVAMALPRGNHCPLLAAAGGISPANAAAYAGAGAGLIVTSWPYTARPKDVAVSLGPSRPA